MCPARAANASGVKPPPRGRTRHSVARNTSVIDHRCSSGSISWRFMAFPFILCQPLFASDVSQYLCWPVLPEGHEGFPGSPQHTVSVNKRGAGRGDE